MSKTRETFSTPVGRLVQGDAFVPQTKDQTGALRVYKSGDKVGQPNPQYFVAVAFPKVDPLDPSMQNREFAAFYALLERVARAEWPALWPNPTGPCVNPIFTLKVKDGDGLDRNGKPNNVKEGFAGHWVVSFASAYAPKVVRETSPGTNVWETLTDPSSVKRGYYVRIAGSATGNDSPNTPGIYCNLDMIALIAFGQEIVSGPDAATAFGGTAATLPAGASALPMGGGTMPPAGAGAAPTTFTMTPKAAGQTREQYHAAGWTDAQLIEHGMMLAPVAAPTVAAPPPPVTAAPPPPVTAAPPPPVTAAPPPPVTAPPPNTAYMTPPPAAPAGPVMTPKAAGQTREQYHAAGWTDAQLIEHGMMEAAPAAPLSPAGSVAAPPPPPIAPSPASLTTTSLSKMTDKAAGQTREQFIAAGWTDQMLIDNGYMTA